MFIPKSRIVNIKFPTSVSAIKERIEEINPIQYGKTRNHKNGAITYLSPYISRGVISTKQVYDSIIDRELKWYQIEKLVQELAWRDYWQQVWIAKGDEIFNDLKNEQTPVHSHEMPKAIVHANTGIIEVDLAIKELYETGYMHNHMRMYVASICCNIAKCHWLTPSKWMYSHLLDGDSASNSLSWQWVAGAFSNKKYYANQENINTFFGGNQTGTFIDVSYDEFENLPIPEILKETVSPEFNLSLPDESDVIEKKDSLIYNYYNLDPNWHKESSLQRILLLEPSFFKNFPIQQNVFEFVRELSENIENIKVFVGEFSELEARLKNSKIIYKEHPTNSYYKGQEEARDWMSDTKGYFPSFFSFWKKYKKQL